MTGSGGSGALAGTAALVTGAASGMGRATALLAAQEGASVLCLDVVSPAETAGEIERLGGTALALEGDVRDAAMWADAVSLARRELGGVHLLANVAGIVAARGSDTVVDQTEEGWQRVIDINLKGVWLGMRAVLPAMIEAGSGRIVNVASEAAIRGLPLNAAYTASKGGVVALTRQAAVDYGRYGIRVNAVAPGDIDTPMSRDNPPEVKASLLRRTVVGRQGTAEDVAAAIVFLATPAADYVTGQVLAVDGGWGIKG